MTQLSPNPFADILRERIEKRRSNRSRLSSLFDEARSARQPYEGPERRASQRITLDELEQLTESDLGQRLESRIGPEDDRSGFVKFFDILDLPRNLVAQAVIRPFLSEEQVDESRKGTFGLPQVTFSQALDAAGMEPGFARGALGFVGDIATDPLTYLGAGAAAKLPLKAGSVGIRKGTSKTLDKAIRGVARSGEFAPERLSGRLAGLEGVIGRSARPSVLAAAKRQERSAGNIEVILRESILGKARVPGSLDATAMTIRMTPTEIGRRLAKGQWFKPEQLAADPRLARLQKAAQSLQESAGGRISGLAETTGEVAAMQRQQDIARRIRSATRKAFKNPVTIPTTRNDPLITPWFQPGRIAREIGQDQGIADFIKREAIGRGLGFHVPFTDRGIQLTQNDPRLRALAAGDANPFMAEIGEAGTGFSDTILQRVSKGIRGVRPAAETAAYRTAIANGITAVDRNLQQFFGYGNRVAPFAQMARVTENLKSAEFAAAHSLALQLSKQIDEIAAESGSPELADKVRETIAAQLEVGMARVKDPNGKALFGSTGDIDFSNLTPETAGDIANRIRQAKATAAESGIPWDEIMDKVADGLETQMWFNPKVREFVARNQKMYNSIEESAVKGGLLDDGLENFLGRTPNQEAAEALRERRLQEPIIHGSRQEAAVLHRQGFQKHRTTNRYIWNDPKTQQVKSYYGFQLAEDPRAQAEVRAAIKAGLVPEAGYQSSIFHVNEMARTGQLDSLLGGGWRTNLFDENPAMALAANYRQAQKAKIGRDFENYIGRFARVVDRKRVNEFEGGKLIESIKGTGAYRVLAPELTDDAGNLIASQGDIVRQLKLDSSHPLFKSLGKEKTMFFDDRIATRIEDYADFYRDPGKIAKFLGLVDPIVKQLRAITLAHPSWMLTNTISNLTSAVLMGAGPQHVPLFKTASNVYGKYQAFIREGLIDTPDFARFLDETVDIGQRTYRVGDLVRSAEATGVLEQGRILRELVNGMANDPNALQNVAKAPGVAGRAGKIYTKSMGKWFMMNHSLEQRQRLFGMMVRLAEGDTLQDAAATTIRHMFDYCVDESTEILTQRGWLTLDQVTTEDLAYSIDPKTGKSDFVKINSVNIFPAGLRKMIRSSSTRFNALTTTSHRWLCEGSGVRGGHHTIKKDSTHFSTSLELMEMRKVMLVGGGEYTAPTTKVFSDEMVELVGWVVTEGEYKKIGNGVIVSQSRTRLFQHIGSIRKLREHFRSTGATVSEYQYPGKVTHFYFGKGIGKIIRQIAPNKQLTCEFLLSLTMDQLNLLYRTLMDADGHVRKDNGTEIFAQKDQERIASFQMLCAMLGHRTRSRIDQTGCSKITVYKSSRIYPNEMKWSIEDYSGRVWCPSTETGTWFARHNGVTFCTGNSDFTRFETDFMRKLFYFYPWVRNNAPFMMTKLFEDPKWAAMFPKLKEAFEDTVADEDRIPENQRPEWFRDQLGFQIASRSGLLLPMLTQFQDVAEVGQALTGKREDIKEFLHYLTSQLNPVFQLPFELAQGREFFTGREIGDPDLGEMSVGQFLGGQLRPFREGQKLAQIKTPGQAAARLTIGGRYQTLDPERAVRSGIFKLSEEAQAIRNQINRARDDGDNARAIRLAVRLQQTWRKILELDPDSDRVPNQVKQRLLAN